MTTDRLHNLLKRHFGFDEFRPLQREIIEDSLAGKDIIALLPTGGGKSLCYQLRALASDGLTLVISPLIALMKDQVDALSEQDVPATFLNSSLDSEEAVKRLRGLDRGEYRLLYLAPERLVMDGMLDRLKHWKLSFLAIDEAHCISEWGHDFRPEYRQLALLRSDESFSEVPIMALTATATQRVREDIASILKLRGARKYVASFNRPNLSYRIIQRHEPVKQILEILSEHRDESGIIYCMSRARTEEVAKALTANGHKACAYHAGFESTERTRRQDLFINDEVQIVVATIAFGMGIDKSDVRFVIHHDLPKNIESYYQETGRAGRDGLPSECVLLYSNADYAKLMAFVGQMTDEVERRNAQDHLGQMLRFSESSICRRIELLKYFGETYQNDDGKVLDACGACDNCLTPRPTFDGTTETQKIISCILRVKQRSGFGMGPRHIADILRGADTEKIRKFGHHALSTYGIGQEHSSAAWMAFIQQLVHKGLIEVRSDHFGVVEVCNEGLKVLQEKQQIFLREPLLSARLTREKKRQQRSRTGASQQVDSALFGELRSLRIRLARARKIPAYMVFSDATLQDMAIKRPQQLQELRQVIGVGDKKLEQYGQAFLEVLTGSPG